MTPRGETLYSLLSTLYSLLSTLGVGARRKLQLRTMRTSQRGHPPSRARLLRARAAFPGAHDHSPIRRDADIGKGPRLPILHRPKNRNELINIGWPGIRSSGMAGGRLMTSHQRPL